MEVETLDTVQARHRKELRDLQSRITNKKKNATKKTRKGVNDECVELERQLKQKQAQELSALSGEAKGSEEADVEDEAEDANGVAVDDQNTSNNLAAQLNNKTIADAVSSQQESSKTIQQSGKKRNRQKERMARRAAEQEAAAVAAEEEAANMTDHRGIEKTYLLAEFKAKGLEEKEIQPDGHCLFAAVADQLAHQSISLGLEAETRGKLPYKVMRKRATEYMEAHADDFAPFLEEDFEVYVRKIRDTAEWGGQLELTALANAYEVEIRVLQDGRTEVIEPVSRQGEGEVKRIWLAYYRHGYGLGEHYNSLRKTTV